jgi:hypothetical protein
MTRGPLDTGANPTIPRRWEPIFPSGPLLPPDAFREVCQPEVDYVNTVLEGDGMLFHTLVDDVPSWIRNIARRVCSHLYKDPSEAHPVRKVTLRIDDFPGVGWKAGNRHVRVGVSSQHLRNIANAGRHVGVEVEGILVHELAHGYQYNHAKPPLWLIEGIADSVRIKDGFHPLSVMKPGGHWTGAYTTTGFFLAWLDDTQPGFLYRLNQTLREGQPEWREEVFGDLTGTDVATLWNQYQAAIATEEFAT